MMLNNLPKAIELLGGRARAKIQGCLLLRPILSAHIARILPPSALCSVPVKQGYSID
jgi:hypothetical protein